MKLLSIILSMLTALGIFPITGKVIELDRRADTVTIDLANGHRYAFTGCEDYEIGDYVSALLMTCRTSDPADDRIISAHYAGFSDYETNEPPHLPEFADEFKRDFPEEEYTLFTAAEAEENPEILTARAEWDELLVVVTTGTVTNEDGDGREDLPAPYNYISYRGVPFRTSPGDRIVTYLVYARNAHTDDILTRYDYPLN